jgi:hypothetical protein
VSLAKKLRPHLANLVIVAAAVLAGGVYLVVDRGSVSTGEAVTRKKNLLDAWRADDVTEVVLAAHGHTTRLTRGAPDAHGQRAWQVDVDGRRYAADEQAVDGLLGTLAMAVYERAIAPESVDRGAFRLDAPAATIAVAMGPRSYRVALGGPAPKPAGGSYAEVNGRGVVVVTKELVAALDVAPDHFRTRSLVPLAAAELGALRLDGQGGARHLARASWGGERGSGFRFDGSTPEGSVRADAVAVDRILGALERLRADELLADDAADQALRRDVTVTLVPKAAGEKPTVLDVGGACPGRDDHVVVVRREPTRVSACVGKGAVEPLSTPVDALVDKRLVGAPIDEIAEVSLASGDRKLELARSGTGWRLRAPSDRELDGSTGRAFVEGLLRLAADRFVPPSEAASLGLGTPHATLRVRSTAGGGAAPAADAGLDSGGPGERVEIVEIGAPTDKGLPVRRVEDGAVALLPRDAAQSLEPSDLALRPRKVIDEPARRIRSMRIDARGRVQRAVQVPDAGWRYVEPSGVPIDQGLAGDLAGMIGSLTAERWVADKDDGSFGLASPRVVVEAVVGDEPDGATDAAAPPGTRTLRLELGAPTAEGAFARLDGGAVFLAPRLLEETAERWLVDRNALLFVPNDIARVTLASGGGKKKLVVERAPSGAWRTVGPGGEDPDGARRAASVRDAFSELMPEGAVTLGKPAPGEGFDKPRLAMTIELLPGKASVGAAPPADGAALTTRLLVGAGDAWHGTNVVYVRREGVDATYAVAQARIRPLLEALGER